MTILVDLSHRHRHDHGLGGFALDVRFEGEKGLTALFGRSGSGKTSVVDLVAGLARPDRGRIAVDGAVLVDTAARVFVPRHRRRVGYVFQDARLFPHLSVRQNLLYGRWFTPAAERYGSLEAVVDLLGIAPILHRRPAFLSGGERQRVAIGRALLASPRLLLMDEPLAALDDARKAEVMPYIERLRDEAAIPILYVSHSVPEVRRLASKVVVLEAGRVAAEGEPGAVLRWLGLLPNVIDAEAGSVVDAAVERHDRDAGLTVLGSAAGRFRVPLIEAVPGTPVRIRIAARDVLIAAARPEGISAPSILDGTVAAVAAVADGGGGAACDVTLDCGGVAILARLARSSAAALDLAPGRRVHAVVNAVSIA